MKVIVIVSELWGVASSGRSLLVRRRASERCPHRMLLLVTYVVVDSGPVLVAVVDLSLVSCAVHCRSGQGQSEVVGYE